MLNKDNYVKDKHKFSTKNKYKKVIMHEETLNAYNTNITLKSKIFRCTNSLILKACKVFFLILYQFLTKLSFLCRFKDFQRNIYYGKKNSSLD